MDDFGNQQHVEEIRTRKVFSGLPLTPASIIAVDFGSPGSTQSRQSGGA